MKLLNLKEMFASENIVFIELITIAVGGREKLIRFSAYKISKTAPISHIDLWCNPEASIPSKIKGNLKVDDNFFTNQLKIEKAHQEIIDFIGTANVVTFSNKSIDKLHKIMGLKKMNYDYYHLDEFCFKQNITLTQLAIISNIYVDLHRMMDPISRARILMYLFIKLNQDGLKLLNNIEARLPFIPKENEIDWNVVWTPTFKKRKPLIVHNKPLNYFNRITIESIAISSFESNNMKIKYISKLKYFEARGQENCFTCAKINNEKDYQTYLIDFSLFLNKFFIVIEKAPIFSFVSDKKLDGFVSLVLVASNSLMYLQYIDLSSLYTTHKEVSKTLDKYLELIDIKECGTNLNFAPFIDN